MALNGVFGVVYCGGIGLGIAVLKVTDGHVEGCDYSGARYTGTAVEVANGVTLDVAFDVPAGVGLVQGTAAQDIPHRRRITHTFPAELGDGKPQEIPIPPGIVTVMVKRISDDLAEAATNGFTLQVAQQLAGR